MYWAAPARHKSRLQNKKGAEQSAPFCLYGPVFRHDCLSAVRAGPFYGRRPKFALNKCRAKEIIYSFNFA
jgi:hypothetical protein